MVPTLAEHWQQMGSLEMILMPHADILIELVWDGVGRLCLYTRPPSGF